MKKVYFYDFLKSYGSLSEEIVKYLETNNIYLEDSSVMDDSLISTIEEKFGKPSAPTIEREMSVYSLADFYGIKTQDITKYLRTKNVVKLDTSTLSEKEIQLVEEKFGPAPVPILIKKRRIIDLVPRYGVTSQEIVKYLASINIPVRHDSIVSEELENIIDRKFGKTLKHNKLECPIQSNNTAFSFLKGDYDELYQLCSDVAKFIETEKSVSMLKARQAIEVIVKYLGAESNELFENINYLDENKIAPSRIIELLHLIRKEGNKSVHNDTNVDVEAVLDALTEICVWLFVEHDKKSFCIDEFNDKERICLKNLL